MKPASQAEVDAAITRFGNYRTKRTQTVALEGEPDGISGSLLMAFGCRETWLQNIEGGAKKVNNEWVPLDPKNPADAAIMDVGCFQLSRKWQEDGLRALGRAVKTNTWKPYDYSHSPFDAGYVPLFEDSLRYTIELMHEHMAFAEDDGIKKLDDRVLIAIGAHNRGYDGALKGFKQNGIAGIDAGSTGGDYVSWVLACRTQINKWLGQHPGWKVG